MYIWDSMFFYSLYRFKEHCNWFEGYNIGIICFYRIISNLFITEKCSHLKENKNKIDDEVKLAVAPCGSSEKNCWGWEGVSLSFFIFIIF